VAGRGKMAALTMSGATAACASGSASASSGCSRGLEGERGEEATMSFLGGGGGGGSINEQGLPPEGGEGTARGGAGGA